MSPREDPGLVAFAERCLTLLDQGSFSTTYKYAVLLGLLDLCLEEAGRGGERGERISTEQLAQKVIELYWPQTTGFGEADLLLLQVRSKTRLQQAEIVTLIRDFRSGSGMDPLAPLSRARLEDPAGFLKLVRDVEWKLIEMPLPKLQRMGGELDEFLYHISWDDRIGRREVFAPGFDRALHLHSGVSARLVQLAGLLRPLLHREWAAKVAQCNPELKLESLEQHLFGQPRLSLEPLRKDLREFQEGRCFYCQESIRGSGAVDHFMPWARYPNNAIENLVLTDTSCNGSKRDFFAAPGHLARWRARLLPGSPEAGHLAEIATRQHWEQAATRSERVVRAVYLRLPEGVRLWKARDQFEKGSGEAIRRALGAG